MIMILQKRLVFFINDLKTICNAAMKSKKPIVIKKNEKFIVRPFFDIKLRRSFYFKNRLACKNMGGCVKVYPRGETKFEIFCHL